MTKNDETFTVEQRIKFWETAAAMVEPIIEKHGIELVVTGAMFGPNYKTTAVEQHINHIISVADWLMDRDPGV